MASKRVCGYAPKVWGLICKLQAKKSDGELCDQGKARLKWWFANGKKFESIIEGVKTWKKDDILSFLNYVGIDDSDDIEEAINDIQETIDGHDIPKDLQNQLTKVLKAYKPDVNLALLKGITDDQFLVF